MSYNFSISFTPDFAKSAKQLAKKYPSIKSDIEILKHKLLENPALGTPLGKNCYKIRFKISAKPSGKSGGARVITFVKLLNQQIVLLDIYDKSDRETITDKELDLLIKSISN